MPRLGEVWDTEFDPVIGHEQGGRRPALIISSDEFNDIPHGLRIVVPFTSVDRGIPSHIRLEPAEGGLAKASILMCEQAKSISVLRCRKRRGVVSQQIVRTAQAMVGVFLGIEQLPPPPEPPG